MTSLFSLSFLNFNFGIFLLQVSLRRNSSHTCGGSILNENHILTAAHCVCDVQTRLFCMDSSSFSLTCTITKPQSAHLFSIQYDVLKIGDKDVNTIDVNNVYCHKFNVNSLTFDAAVLEVSVIIVFRLYKTRYKL